MNREEFAAWTKETETSATRWTKDPVVHGGNVLFYKGGESGIYLTFSPNGEVEGGFYSEAVPHIGEAAFRSAHKRTFGSRIQALGALTSKFGVDFMGMTMGPIVVRG